MGMTGGSGSIGTEAWVGTGAGLCASGVETNVSAGKGASGLVGAPGATGGTSRGFSKLADSPTTGSGGTLIGSGAGVIIGCASVVVGVWFCAGSGSDMIITFSATQ